MTNVGRAHLKTPYSGHTEIFIRAQRFNLTTAATHVNDEKRNGKWKVGILCSF